MADLGAVQTAWAAWDDAPVAATARAAVDAAQVYARVVASGAQADAEALWTWLGQRWAQWQAYDAQHRADASYADKEIRELAADGMRALLGVARNSASQASHAATILRHWSEVCGVMSYLLLFENMVDPTLIPVVRVLAQLLANAVTSDLALQQIVWDLHVLGKQAQSPDALVRLMSSSDARTVLAASVLLLNCVDTALEEELNGSMTTPPQKVSFALDLVQTPQGIKIMETVIMVYDAALISDPSKGGSVQTMAQETVDVITSIVQRLMRCGHFGKLLLNMRPTSGGEPHVSTSQVTLLHILAACLESRLERCKGEQHTHRISSRMLSKVMQKSERYMNSMVPLLSVFRDVAHYTIQTMKEHVDGRGVVDFRGLIRAHMALLAALQCLHLSGMCGQEDVARRETTGNTQFLARLRSPDDKIVETCVTLLHEVNRFFPAQSPFQTSGKRSQEEETGSVKAKKTDKTVPDMVDGEHGMPDGKMDDMRDDTRDGHADGHADGEPAADGHAGAHAVDDDAHGAHAADGPSDMRDGTPNKVAMRSDAGAGASTQPSAAPLPDGHVPTPNLMSHPVTDSRPALHRLKCSVLQLIGTIVYEPPGMPRLAEVTALQDRVREQGGLLDALSMTQADQHNPYIREYAIFTLRYLLAQNPASQRLVAELRPIQPNDGAARTDRPPLAGAEDVPMPTASGAAALQ